MRLWTILRGSSSAKITPRRGRGGGPGCQRRARRAPSLPTGVPRNHVAFLCVIGRTPSARSNRRLSRSLVDDAGQHAPLHPWCLRADSPDAGPCGPVATCDAPPCKVPTLADCRSPVPVGCWFFHGTRRDGHGVCLSRARCWCPGLKSARVDPGASHTLSTYRHQAANSSGLAVSNRRALCVCPLWCRFV